MRLSNQYRVLYWRQAALTDDQILNIYNRYDYLENPKEELAQFKEIQDTLSAYTTKTDLLAEWVVKSMAHGSGHYPEDMARFINAAMFYFNIYAPTADPNTRLQKIQKFRDIVKQFNLDTDKTNNPKNILDFTLHNMETMESNYTDEPVDPRVNRLEGALPEGSKMIYNDGTYQVVEITSPQAACHFGRGTRWCTSDEEVASNYLETSPLYVIFIKGKKYGQMHIDGMETQFMDLQDNPMAVSDEVRSVLIKAGLLQKIFTKIGEYGYDEQEDFYGDVLEFWENWVGKKRVPELEDTIKLSPKLSYEYVSYIIGHRAPEFEESISQDGPTSYIYAREVLGGRFEMGEPAIINNSLLHKYANFLGTFKIGQLKSFLDDYPDNRNLDEYRYRVFNGIVQVGDTVYRKTGHMKYISNLHKLVVQYEFWHGQQPEDKYIWLDESGSPVHELNQLVS